MGQFSELHLIEPDSRTSGANVLLGSDILSKLVVLLDERTLNRFQLASKEACSLAHKTITDLTILKARNIKLSDCVRLTSVTAPGDWFADAFEKIKPQEPKHILPFLEKLRLTGPYPSRLLSEPLFQHLRSLHVDDLNDIILGQFTFPRLETLICSQGWRFTDEEPVLEDKVFPNLKVLAVEDPLFVTSFLRTRPELLIYRSDGFSIWSCAQDFHPQQLMLFLKTQLRKSPSFDVNMPDLFTDLTPLAHAIDGFRPLESVKILLKHGANPLQRYCYSYEKRFSSWLTPWIIHPDRPISPLFHALITDKPAVATLLLDSYSNLIKAIDMQEWISMEPVHPVLAFAACKSEKLFKTFLSLNFPWRWREYLDYPVQVPPNSKLISPYKLSLLYGAMMTSTSATFSALLKYWRSMSPNPLEEEAKASPMLLHNVIRMSPTKLQALCQEPYIEVHNVDQHGLEPIHYFLEINTQHYVDGLDLSPQTYLAAVRDNKNANQFGVRAVRTLLRDTRSGILPFLKKIQRCLLDEDANGGTEAIFSFLKSAHPLVGPAALDVLIRDAESLPNAAGGFFRAFPVVLEVQQLDELSAEIFKQQKLTSEALWNTLRALKDAGSGYLLSLEFGAEFWKRPEWRLFAEHLNNLKTPPMAPVDTPLTDIVGNSFLKAKLIVQVLLSVLKRRETENYPTTENVDVVLHQFENLVLEKLTENNRQPSDIVKAECAGVLDRLVPLTTRPFDAATVKRALYFGVAPDTIRKIATNSSPDFSLWHTVFESSTPESSRHRCLDVLVDLKVQETLHSKFPSREAMLASLRHVGDSTLSSLCKHAELPDDFGVVVTILSDVMRVVPWTRTQNNVIPSQQYLWQTLLTLENGNGHKLFKSPEFTGTLLNELGNEEIAELSATLVDAGAFDCVESIPEKVDSSWYPNLSARASLAEAVKQRAASSAVSISSLQMKKAFEGYMSLDDAIEAEKRKKTVATQVLDASVSFGAVQSPVFSSFAAPQRIAGNQSSTASSSGPV